MAWSLLLIEEGGLSLAPTLAAVASLGAATRWERISWRSVLSQSLVDHPADLILPVALDEPARPLGLFRFMQEHPLRSPTLAILPGAAKEELWRAAASVATDFMAWPAQPEELVQRLMRILGRTSEEQPVRGRLLDENGLVSLVGHDPAFLAILAQIPRIAGSDRPVLITGETGTGKELCARAIHRLSRRRDAPFLAVDCAAFPDHLFENEMFGHARGAFTDAHRDQKGLIALAEGGTLFLDEIDSLSPVTQAKLLRFLQERTYRPLGGERFCKADVNVLAATNRDLEQLVERQVFRSDLFFRLNVLRLHMVPLRERRGDVALLARHFVAVLGAENETVPKTLAAATLLKLSGMEWKGNVRELANVVQRAFFLAEGTQILPRHIEAPGAATPGAAESFREARARALATFERQYVSEALRQHQGNITQAARQVGKDRRAFGRLVKRHKIDRQSC
jgi:two-component system response regulator GlrR